MASTVLPNGIIIPEKFSRDWYADLYHNWQELDNLLSASPGDGTLTIQKNGTTVGTFSANQATDETINITVPDVNDATLTIQQNGTTVDTFTANSSSDKTVNITVPTKTSDLTNDSGFITSDNTKIPLAGSNQISGDLVPSTDGTVNLGGSSYQWNQAYIKSLTINGVACGDILTHNVSEFVKVTGNQFIAGSKTFSSDIRISKTSPFCNVFSNGYIKGQAPTSNIYSGVRFFDDINSGSTNSITGGFEVEYNRDGYNKSYIASRNYAGENHRFFTVGLRVPNDDTRSVDFLPSVSNQINLGISTNKWKSLNGIALDELGLPTSTYTDVSSYITNFDSTPNIFTAPVSGLLFLEGSNANHVECVISNTTKGYTMSVTYAYNNISGLFPVEKGDSISVFISQSINDMRAEIMRLKGKV